MIRTTFAVLVSAALALPALAGDAAITVGDPYARASSPTAKSGAAFMVLTNTSDADDRLIGATSDAAQRVEIHTHLEDANGVMRMVEVEDGIALAAGTSHMLARGGDHIMFMGLTQPFVDGETVTVTLEFETAGEMTVDIPVDLNRRPGDHGAMGHATTN